MNNEHLYNAMHRDAQLRAYLKFGCPVCGYGVDWTYYREGWHVLQTGVRFTSFTLGWMMYEYLCETCWEWAYACGAWSNGVPKFRFEDFEVCPS